MGNCLVFHKKANEIASANGAIIGRELPSKLRRPIPETIPDSNINPRKIRAVKIEDDDGVVRIKLVLSKRELNEILTGEFSISGAIRCCEGGGGGGDDDNDDDDDDVKRRVGWRPSLDCIPEGNDAN